MTPRAQPYGRARYSAPPGLIPLAGVLLLASAGADPVLCIFASAALLAGYALLWRPGEPPILLFVFAYQWTQASILAFRASLTGTNIVDLTERMIDPTLAIFMSVAGVLALAIGMRLGAGPGLSEATLRIPSLQIYSRPTIVWAKLYVLAFTVATVAQVGASLSPGLSQPLLALANLKWGFYWILVYASLAKPGAPKVFFLVALLVELVLGIGGYFSEFKTVLFMTVFAVITANVKLSPKAVIGVVILSVLLVGLGVVWTAIKRDYRTFVSGGRNAQIVQVGYWERANALVENVQALDSERMSAAVDQLLRRITYVEFFAFTLEYVPHSVPFEDGAIWFDAVARPFMPRLIFPDKTVIDDSERTAKYTGTSVAGADRGTSISLGYVAESYIDFGSVFMYAPILLLGFALGRGHRILLTADRSRGVLGMGLSCASLYSVAFLETSITKLFGGLVVIVLANWVVVAVIVPRYIPWLIFRPQRVRR